MSSTFYRLTWMGDLWPALCWGPVLLAFRAMVAIRCTQKLLARIGAPSPVTQPTTTLLGDWCARPVSIGHQRLILLISEHSRLPVIMPGRDVKHLARNFPVALARVLLELGIGGLTFPTSLDGWGSLLFVD